MGKQWKQCQTLFFWDPKSLQMVIASHEIKRHLLLGRKVMTNLDSILKSRGITSPTKVHLVKAMVFVVVMYGCESWTIKKAEHQKVEAFELRCWRRLLKVPCTARRSIQSILKDQFWVFIGRTDVEAETPIFWPPDVKSWLIWKDPDAAKDWKQEKKGTTEDEMVGWHHSLSQWTWVWVNSGSWWWTGRPCMLQFMGHQDSDTTERLNWTEEDTLVLNLQP